MLLESRRPLVEEFDLFMVDLDGVVYIGGRAVAGAPEALSRVRAAGSKVAFVTNNASRTAQTVATHLNELGVEAAATDVVTSSQAAAGLLVREWGVGARVLMLGAEGLREALVAVGLDPVLDVTRDDVVAVVTGFGPDVLWRDVMRVAVRIRQGLPWVATNTDMSFPTDYGQAPGHGVQVEMLSQFSGVTPQVGGKPSRPLLDETMARAGTTSAVMVGDRLDTDMEGAHNVGVPSLLVLTGVTGLAELVAATPQERPSYIASTLQGIFEPHPVATTRVTPGLVTAALDGWEVTVTADGHLSVRGGGDGDDWWRAVASAAWRHQDEGRGVVLTGSVVPPSEPVARDG
ncbi:HAD-IIA family hydrolase [Nocardioides gilvus]|uniref:HAD-IIA family hydrolase n=1 Tax=Nocardioides gilvus TaxID=1735589 RepID=UPI001EF66262|nr:HAD-IIA family hydrolase [Nocardioides gilvus]